jgi:tetratricopeptide (TPR) repeat protein
MPTVVHGIGTWYYGKRHIHTRQGTCEFCGNTAELSSYDTTLFFVVVFVPLLPLARKRILEQCACCQKHRVLSLARWQEAKATDAARVLDNLHHHPNDRQTMLDAIRFVQAYQDEPLFDELIVPLTDAHRGDAVIQAQLGEAYAYFARWPQAEAAYRASLAVEDHEFVRERVAWALLKQGRPQDAAPLLQHILDQKIEAGAGMIYYLVNGYQAEGRHDEALALMDQRDAAFPQFVGSKAYVKQRKLSTRHRGTEKRIASAALAEGGKTGYRAGNWTARLPGWIALFLLLGAVGAYLGSAWWIGQARKVFLVNGTGRPYTVVIEGTAHTLPAQTATPLRMPEGELEVTFRDAPPGLDPVRCRIETSFWTRPFAGHTFVVNPDRAALVVQEETVYTAAAPPPGRRPQLHLGQGFYHFSGLDYEFTEFPRTLSVKGGGTVTKTRVALGPNLPPEARLVLMLQHLSGQEQVDFCKRLLLLDPGNTLFLYWLSSRLPPEPMLTLFQAHLDDRPPLIDWHRAYQSLMEKAHPETDLRPRYQKLLADTKGHADAIYLLGRVEPDPDEADKLFRQAADAAVPSGHAMYALGYRALTEARFADASRWFAKSLARVSDKAVFRHVYHEALLAQGDYERLLRELQKDTEVPGAKIVALTEIAKVHAIQGHLEEARSAVASVVQLYPEEDRQVGQRMLEANLCCWQNDLKGYLKSASAEPGPPSFPLVFLQGKLKEAAALAPQTDYEAAVCHALVYLGATRSGAKGLAQEQWQALLADLAQGGREERQLGDLLAGRKPLTPRAAQRLLIVPRQSRVFLLVIAQRLGEQSKEVVDLARRLDYHRDPISLCLRGLR